MIPNLNPIPSCGFVAAVLITVSNAKVAMILCLMSREVFLVSRVYLIIFILSYSISYEVNVIIITLTYDDNDHNHIMISSS